MPITQSHLGSITSVLNTSLVVGRDADNQIKFGTEVLLRVTKQVKAAMLYASNALIQTALEINKTERLYEYYNLGNIQGNALKEKQYKKQLSDYIKHQLIFNLK